MKYPSGSELNVRGWVGKSGTRMMTPCLRKRITKATDDHIFSFADDRQMKAEAEQLMRELSKEITDLTVQAEGKEWETAREQASEYLSQLYNLVEQTQQRQDLFLDKMLEMKGRNMDALEAFQKRKIGGLKLSDKVWDYTEDFERQMETAIDTALLEGKSADALSRDIRSLLKDPDLLFRRVRDKETGELRMSKAMAAFHPGPGKYRSAYKNAMRLARSEINMAYRSSDCETAQQFDACVGIRVNLSNNHNCKGVPEGQFYDICDELEGDYPRNFKFVGWHPQCYSSDSEVYTADGWKFFKDVKDDDLILSLNPETRDLEYVGITLNISRPHKGKMVHLHNRSYSQLVTPEHEVLVVSKNDGWTFKRIEAEQCGKSQPIYRSSEWRGKKIDSVKIGTHDVKFALFAKFMGYWLSDGSLGHRYEVGIAQQDEDRARIYDCIADMGMKPRYNGGKIEFNDKDWYEYLSQFGKAADKFVPSEIKESDKTGIRVFLDAFISCDGHIKKAKPFVGSHGNLCVPKDDERVYCTSSKRMASDLGELILKTGNRPSYHVSHTAGKQQEFRNGVYTINYDCITISECRSQYATQYQKDFVDYDGMVYDLTLERNNTMYIRRNGKCFWGSNCRCFITYILKTDEEFWRDLENGENNESVNTVHDVPDQFKQWVADNEDRIARAKTLPYFLRDNEQYWKVEGTAIVPAAAPTAKELPSIFTTRKVFDNGGSVQIMEGVDKGKSDYRDILTISTLFAKEGETVKILARTHFKSETYKEVFGSLVGTKYERKCPDILVGDLFYEYESYERPWNKRKISNMLSHGLKQSSRIIIDNNKGASDRFIRKAVAARLHINQQIDEVWIYEKGSLRLFFKDGEFIKNNRGK
ncbi:MAG: hypothetical protein IJ057_09100 [Bacteroidales bacterium]|nr:hypothetical protein [Bacteroidales bacterium]